MREGCGDDRKWPIADICSHLRMWLGGNLVAVREPDPTPNPTPQYDQLMSERRILCLKPAI